MAYRLILDENVEHEVFHRLENDGNHVERVDFVPELGKETADHNRSHGNHTDRVIVPDDDFVLEVDDGLYRAVLYFTFSMRSIERIADIIHTVSQNYPQAESQGLKYVGEEWR